MKRIFILIALARIARAGDDAQPEPLYSKTTGAALIAGTWGAVSVYAYFAWFRHATRTTDPIYNLEGFGVHTYAGGADKLGHFWAGHMLTYATTEALTHAGYRVLPSSLIALGITQAFGTFSEYKDSLHYQFEFGDIIANCSGAIFTVLLENIPKLDRLFDFRVEYWPTHEYLRLLRHGNVDGVQDYSGQSYMLALHLREALPSSPWLGWGKYVDAVVGFETRNYAPAPDDPTAIPRQVLYLGASIDVQAVLDHFFADSLGRQIGKGVAEFVTLPDTTLRFGELYREAR